MDDIAPPTYTARANAVESEAIWRVGPDALELQGGPTAGPDVVLRFPYRDIVGVRLSDAPSRADSARYRCDLKVRSAQQLAILSTHYAGEHILLLAMVVLLVFALSVTGFANLGDFSWVKFAIILFFVPLLIAYTGKNWPRSFKPGAIPKELRP